MDRAGAAYAELALLRGDPSDGLPGVPGVGEKTAATLLAQHGSLDQILAAAHDPKSKMAKGFRAKLLAAERLHRGRAARWCGWPPTRPSRCRRRPTTLPLAAADPKRTAELATAAGRRVVDRAAAESARRAAGVSALLRPADLVGALVVLEGHRHVASGRRRC